MNSEVIMYLIVALISCYVIYWMGIKSGFKKCRNSILAELEQMKAESIKLATDKEAILLVSQELNVAKIALTNWHDALVSMQDNIDKQNELLTYRESNLSERLGNNKG